LFAPQQVGQKLQGDPQSRQRKRNVVTHRGQNQLPKVNPRKTEGQVKEKGKTLCRSDVHGTTKEKPEGSGGGKKKGGREEGGEASDKVTTITRHKNKIVGKQETKKR